jgi:phosphoglycolate phosphatase-like HAD superfamily hydrolase
MRPRLAFFDLDGTVGLIRAGWMRIMVRQALEALRATGTKETDAELRPIIEDYIFRLTGKPTILQMEALAENVRQRGGTPLEAARYKENFLSAIGEVADQRMKELRNGYRRPELHMVPGTRAVLEDLRRLGVKLYLVSGTEHDVVQVETDAFDITRFFDGGVYGTPSDDSTFSKRGLAEQVVANGEAAGPEIISFGDGNAEMEAVKNVGGTAIGLATLEPECRSVDPWKRERLIAAGADYIIPNYLCWNELKEHLFAE